MPKQAISGAPDDYRAFEKFRRDHPEVVDAIVGWALDALADGDNRIYMAELWARARRTCGPGGGKVPFGMNAGLQPFMTRWVVTEYPQVGRLFELRPAKAADAWWLRLLRGRGQVRDVPRPRPSDDE